MDNIIIIIIYNTDISKYALFQENLDKFSIFLFSSLSRTIKTSHYCYLECEFSSPLNFEITIFLLYLIKHPKYFLLQAA